MAFFNPYFNPYSYQYPQAPAQNNAKIYVQGEAAAKSYLVAPNATVTLWDSERAVFYEKTADMNGVPTIKRYKYIEECTEAPQDGISEQRVDYVTRNDLEAVYGQISDLRAELEGLSIRRPSKKKEATDDE